MSKVHRSSTFRRFWKPAAVVGAGSTAAAIWVEDILLYAEIFVALILLPIMAAIVYVFNIFIFKSRLPKGEDLTNPKHNGDYQ